MQNASEASVANYILFKFLGPTKYLRLFLQGGLDDIKARVQTELEELERIDALPEKEQMRAETKRRTQECLEKVFNACKSVR